MCNAVLMHGKCARDQCAAPLCDGSLLADRDPRDVYCHNAQTNSPGPPSASANNTTQPRDTDHSGSTAYTARFAPAKARAALCWGTVDPVLAARPCSMPLTGLHDRQANSGAGLRSPSAPPLCIHVNALGGRPAWLQPGQCGSRLAVRRATIPQLRPVDADLLMKDMLAVLLLSLLIWSAGVAWIDYNVPGAWPDLIGPSDDWSCSRGDAKLQHAVRAAPGCVR